MDFCLDLLVAISKEMDWQKAADSCQSVYDHFAAKTTSTTASIDYFHSNCFDSCLYSHRTDYLPAVRTLTIVLRIIPVLPFDCLRHRSNCWSQKLPSGQHHPSSLAVGGEVGGMGYQEVLGLESVIFAGMIGRDLSWSCSGCTFS